MATRFNLSYRDSDDETGNDNETVDISFENPKSSEKVAEALQKFLNASGYDNIEVVVNTAKHLNYYVDDEIPF
jgi:hypothetical protein